MVESVTAAAAQKSLKKFHRKSRRHRSALAEATICACFYCLSEYPVQQITEWTDNEETAICPCCGVDAVLGFNETVADQQLLRDMHARWFEDRKELTREEWDGAIERNAWPRAKP